ncbi:MAG TPA: carboxypeptidase-like regulatory domain-containing protein [Pyrinomonadaceae bacterium]
MFCAIACLSPLVHAQQTGVVSGHVTVDGKTAEGVEVLLVANTAEQRRTQVAKTRTDAEGRFRLNVESEGRYQVVPFAPAYVASNTEITVKPGQEITGIDFALVPGGVITGKVLTPDGRPAIAERITLTPAFESGQNRGTLNIPPALLETDDRGVYRIFGLPPGLYLVSAGTAGEHVAAGLRGRRVSYMRTFHPDVTDQTNAKPIEVTAGREVSNVDIAMSRRAEDFTATGRVVDERNQPVANVAFGYAAVRENRRLAGAPVRNLQADAEGKFLIENLTAGRYVLFAVSNSSAYSEIVPFEVTNSDVSGLELKVEPASSVSGVVVVEGGNDVNLTGKLANVSINSVFYQTEMLFTHEMSNINPDGSFRLDGLRPGKLKINVATQRFPRGFSILRVEREGVALGDSLDIPQGTHISGLRVVLTYGNGIVRGQAKIKAEELLPGTRLLVFAQPMGANAGARTHSIAVDPRGSFILESLPAGDYELRLGVLQPGSGNNVRYSTASQTVRVTNNSTFEVTLVFESGAKPEN